MAGPVHFEIQADDLERAKTFYEKSFGWTYQDWSEVSGFPYWGITAGDGSPDSGINGGLLQRPVSAPKPEQGTNAYVCTMAVENYDATEKQILEAGGQVAMAKFAIPGMAWQGYYIDTEGNTFGIHQPDENAK